MTNRERLLAAMPVGKENAISARELVTRAGVNRHSANKPLDQLMDEGLIQGSYRKTATHEVAIYWKDE